MPHLHNHERSGGIRRVDLEDHQHRSNVFIEGLDRLEGHCEGGLMAKKWDGSKVIKEIDEALDRATARFVQHPQQAVGRLRC